MDPASHSKKQGNKRPINDKTYVKLLECESGSFFWGAVGQPYKRLSRSPSESITCVRTT